MIHKFLPHTGEDIQQMLDRIGIKKLEDLYAEVPESIRFKGDYDIPETMSELEIRAFFEKLGQKNDKLTCSQVEVYMTTMRQVLFRIFSVVRSFLHHIPLIKLKYHKEHSIISLSSKV